ncbi:hypothetical protein M427DRAFT_390142 [Gonapodya prolifera JEL478]|uniref:RRM domain-containing protein n=1 Tax=Gonapodya prolifera (strain JEL478) TaxID=1344416 RepID=A0A139A7U5_GONPJ|nr:hypothetical protein M427DRAFT_390142 [Gonapodya prolifera JEL478]|eukprot:KXS12881.1 hypothetical protein M427DRAFT_390142 [Gonapodya prolifera JEL478]
MRTGSSKGGNTNMPEPNEPSHKRESDFDLSPVKGGLIRATGFLRQARECDVEKFFDTYGNIRWIEKERGCGVVFVLFEATGRGTELARYGTLQHGGKTPRSMAHPYGARTKVPQSL